MAHKQILFQSAAREKILRGATQLADAVRITLGPKSKSVLIQKAWGAPIVCNDGVTIAKRARPERRRGKSRCADASPGGRENRRNSGPQRSAPISIGGCNRSCARHHDITRLDQSI